MIEFSKDFFNQAKNRMSDIERIQIYLAQVQGLILGIITHVSRINPKTTIAHLTTLAYSSESDTIYIYFNNAETGRLVKEAIEVLFRETQEECKEITSDEIGNTFVIELNYRAQAIIKYNKRCNLGTHQLKKYV